MRLPSCNPGPIATWSAGTSLAGAAGALLASSCCILPSVLSVLGAGGALASLVSASSFVGAHRLGVQLSVAAVLVLSWVAIGGRLPTRWLASHACSDGATPRRARWIWRAAVGIYVVSVVQAYAGPIAQWLSRRF